MNQILIVQFIEASAAQNEREIDSASTLITKGKLRVSC